MKLPRTAPTGWVRLWFWTRSAHSTAVVPRDRATIERALLVAGGAVVYHSEVLA